MDEIRRTYGMKFRGFSIGCQPMNGLVERIDDPHGKYYDLLIYNRELTKKELKDYELVELFNVVAINKKTREKMILESYITEEEADSFCGAWGWNYIDENCVSWWLEIMF